MSKRSLLCCLPLLALYPSVTHRGFASFAYPKISVSLDIEPFQTPLEAAGGVQAAVRYHSARSRETVGGILRRWGLPRQSVDAVARSCQKLLPERFLKRGQLVKGSFQPEDGRLLLLEVALEDEQMLVAQDLGDGSFAARIERKALERRTVRYRATVGADPSRDLASAGAPPGLLPALAEIYSAVLELPAQLRQGDSINVLAEADYHRGNFVRLGPILAAEVTCGGRSFQAFRFQNRYYDETGRGLRSALLRSPLLQYRVSSSFQSRRLHPIIGKRRPHHGVDLAAPAGTPVRAVGDGEVVFVGRNGGYGRMVKIRHDATYSTLYAHLSRFAPDLQEGQSVHQGDVLGFVGQTGTATGPHVHYEIRTNGRLNNPMTVKLPAPEPVPPADLPAFLNEVRRLGSELSRDLAALALLQP